MAIIKELDWSLASNDLKELTYHLMNDPAYLPDILRDYTALSTVINDTFSCSAKPYALCGPKGIGGMFYVGGIVAGHEASFYCWIWDKSCFNHKALRFMRGYIEAIAKDSLLRRITSRTAEHKLGKLLEHLGFKSEGRFRFGYKTHGKMMTLVQYRAIVDKDGNITGD